MAALALASLRVSRVDYYSVKAVDLRRRRPYGTTIFLSLVILAILFYSEPVLLVLALTYALSGLIHEIPGRQRSNPAASEEVETQ